MCHIWNKYSCSQKGMAVALSRGGCCRGLRILLHWRKIQFMSITPFHAITGASESLSPSQIRSNLQLAILTRLLCPIIMEAIIVGIVDSESSAWSSLGLQVLGFDSWTGGVGGSSERHEFLYWPPGRVIFKIPGPPWLEEIMQRESWFLFYSSFELVFCKFDLIWFGLVWFWNRAWY